jgi:hypothetical protein
MYTADPAPMVHNGTLYLFSSHDQDAGEANNFNMKNWVLATTTDMVNWTQRGVIASLRDFPWAAKEISGWDGFDNGAWAPQAIERDGKWYLYAPVQGRGIGVLVADNPLGPYTDPLKKPLIAGHAGGLYDSIDPTVYIDDKGQAYLAWGNPNLWSVKLNKDMISYDTSVGENGIIGHPMTVKALGERTPPDTQGYTLPKPALRGTSYEEGPWLYKRKNLNYLFFAGGPIPEHLAYSTGPTPEGPWTYGGVVMAPQSAFTNHPGVIDYKGKTYLFYHNAALPGGDGFKRSVCVDELKFNPDGSVPMVQPTREGTGAGRHPRSLQARGSRDHRLVFRRQNRAQQRWRPECARHPRRGLCPGAQCRFRRHRRARLHGQPLQHSQGEGRPAGRKSRFVWAS